MANADPDQDYDSELSDYESNPSSVTEAWYNKHILSCFKFSQNLQDNEPDVHSNIRGKCNECGNSISGRRAATHNFTRHFAKHAKKYEEFKTQQEEENKKKKIAMKRKRVSAPSKQRLTEEGKQVAKKRKEEFFC